MHAHMYAHALDWTLQNFQQLNAERKRKKKSDIWKSEFWRNYAPTFLNKASIFTQDLLNPCAMQVFFPNIIFMSLSKYSLDYLCTLDEAIFN